ncbi:MAG: diacylglycerol kinase family protein [Oscillospiraceae bacterium]
MIAFLKSFVYAAKGIIHAISTGRNMRIHLCAAAYVLYFSLKFYSLSRGELAALILTITAVISLETLNTAVERLADSVTLDTHPLIAKCKDCAAGAVLVSAIGSVFVGITLLWDTEIFSQIFEYFISDILRLLLFLISLSAAILFVVLPELINRKKPQK